MKAFVRGSVARRGYAYPKGGDSPFTVEEVMPRGPCPVVGGPWPVWLAHSAGAALRDALQLVVDRFGRRVGRESKHQALHCKDPPVLSFCVTRPGGPHSHPVCLDACETVALDNVSKKGIVVGFYIHY